jgi:molybdopterin converting factor small subunit
MLTYDVLLFGPLRDRFGSRALRVELGPDITARQLLDHLSIDADVVKVAIDGTIVSTDSVLHAQSEIAILPPVSGG